MTIKFAKFTDTEHETVWAIVERAQTAGIYGKHEDLTAEMDIGAAHADCPLRLDDLLAADDFDFGHDLRGIKHHMNRKTGKLEGFFLPRFAR